MYDDEKRREITPVYFGVDINLKGHDIIKIGPLPSFTAPSGERSYFNACLFFYPSVRSPFFIIFISLYRLGYRSAYCTLIALFITDEHNTDRFQTPNSLSPIRCIRWYIEIHI